jgi:hypothetical protein
LEDGLANDAIGRDGEHSLPGNTSVFGSQDDAFARLGSSGSGLLARDLRYVTIDKATRPTDALVDEPKSREMANRDRKTLPCCPAVAGLR